MRRWSHDNIFSIQLILALGSNGLFFQAYLYSMIGMHQNNASLVEKDNLSEYSHADLARMLRDLELDRQSLGLLCERQREVIIAMRQALTAARCVILQDSSSLFERVERDLARLKHPEQLQQRELASLPVSLILCLQKAGEATPGTSTTTPKHLNFEEVVWTLTKSLAGLLCALARREIARSNMLVLTCRAMLSAANAYLRERTSKVWGRLLSPSDPWASTSEKGRRQHWTGWLDFLCGAVFAMALGIVFGMILFDLVN